MSTLDVEDYNRRWLAAWTAKDVEALLGFYAPDCAFFDPQLPAGLHGHEALRSYLVQLFGATPAMTYTDDKVWATAEGFCGRWYCDIEGGGRLRGFDLVVLDGDRIKLNEVYLHTLG